MLEIREKIIDFKLPSTETLRTPRFVFNDERVLVYISLSVDYPMDTSKKTINNLD
jgi:hypothetical protein